MTTHKDVGDGSKTRLVSTFGRLRGDMCPDCLGDGIDCRLYFGPDRPCPTCNPAESGWVADEIDAIRGLEQLTAEDPT